MLNLNTRQEQASEAPDYLEKLRAKDVFIPELSLVAEHNSGKIVGQIVLCKTDITTSNGEGFLISQRRWVIGLYFCVEIRHFIVNSVLFQAITTIFSISPIRQKTPNGVCSESL